MLKTRYFKGKRFEAIASTSGSNLPSIKIAQQGKRYIPPTDPPVTDSGLPKITIYQTAKRDGGRAIALWTPAQITTDVWLDASSIDNFDLASPNKISQWYDLSGNNRHAQQFTDSSRPIYDSTNKCVTFDGTNDGLVVSNYYVSNRTLDSKVSFFLVIQTPIDSTYRTVFSSDGNVGGYQRGIGLFNSNTIYMAGGADSNNIQNTSNPTGYFILGAIYNYGSNYFLDLNGTLTARGSSETNATVTTSVLSIGFGYPVTTTGDSQNFQGNISEFVATTGNISLQTRQKIEGYLAHKWNTKAYLPSDHPYKNLAPTI